MLSETTYINFNNYSTIFSEPEANNNCFSIITQVIIEIPKQRNVKFLHVERVSKSFWEESFEMKVWRVQVAHLHNAARARSISSRCFQLSTNLDKDFFRYLWYCGKNTNWMWFSMVCAFIDNDTDRHSGQIYCETVLREFNSCFDLFIHVDISKIFTVI